MNVNGGIATQSVRCRCGARHDGGRRGVSRVMRACLTMAQARVCVGPAYPSFLQNFTFYR